ncbi:hypothetical protein AVEN_156282-1 [Araneus ventricosus]|uniref:Deoxyuridine 5'-triphosphate nucleotidohydrolase n=1 Tax=Araneus ventricosus TaxID=182803 RepID=A0A4Y2UGJ8_ARAVE|nr:hypothetical protein AVEN_156282-1 [Araneus ventricosus]
MFPEAVEPTRQTTASVGLDLYTPNFKNVKWTILPGKQYLLDTGIVLELPVDETTHGLRIAALIKDKSSVAYHNGLCVKAGVIDPDFRGSIKILLRNEGEKPAIILGGYKIAQVLFIPTWCPRELVLTMEEETTTERGTREFGGTKVEPQAPETQGDNTEIDS